MAHHQGIRKHVPGARGLGAGPAAPPAEIPDKLYFRIGEAARLCEVPASVLRFWETEFPQLRPNKGGTGQRLFRRRDVEMGRRIKCLLYDEGYTIPGARQLLKTEIKAREPQLTLLGEEPGKRRGREAGLRTLQRGLQDLLALLAPPGMAPHERSSRSGSREFSSKIDRRAPLSTVPVNESLFEFPGSPRVNGMEIDD